MASMTRPTPPARGCAAADRGPAAAGLVYLVRQYEVATVCPNFYVLAHARGCAFRPNCAYCYLRDRGEYGDAGGPPEPAARALAAAREWIARDGLTSWVLNAGNVTDSFCFERDRPLAAELVELFRAEAEARGRRHTLLLVTKGGGRECAALDGVVPCRNVIVSFSVNAPDVARRLESGAAEPADRLDAARRLRERGWRVRLRIDPMIAGASYADTIAGVADVRPERTTLGALRAEGRLTEFVPDGVLDGLLPPACDGEIWRYPEDVRLALYRPAVERLRGVCGVGLCEERPHVWAALGLDPAARGCNCNER
jgi:spore photoproduct lyase